MRSPSAQLVRLLTDLDLCQPRDLRACQGQVRRLARDLPAFDSVWVDALVQRRRLTPYQAEVLLSGDPESLAAGPCVLRDRLGRHDGTHTYLARRKGSRDEQCVVRFVDATPHNLTRVRDAMQRLVSAMHNCTHPAIAGPHATLEYQERLVAVSRFVPGATMRDTLVQAGRLTPGDVQEIGRQLLGGLAAIEPHWPAHADIRIANLRLSPEGRVCLVNCGIALAAEQRFVVHHRLRPDRCDTVAPELIGADREPDAASDLYSLGCLLWHLLCGRPPYSCADPLDKLAAHQTRDLPDVRDIAPDTPEWMAEAIGAMTRRSRELRPASFADAARRWQQHAKTRLPGPTALHRFSPRVREMARRASPPRTATHGLLVATLLICLTGLGLVAAKGTTGIQLLSLTGHTVASPSTPAMQPDIHAQNGPQPLPTPDATGVIALPHAGPWLGIPLESPGPIVIRSPPNQQAVLVLEEPLHIHADSVTLVGLLVRGGTADNLIVCTSRSLRVRQCVFLGNRAGTSLSWQAPPNNDRSAGEVVVTNSRFLSGNVAIELNSTARDLNLGNLFIAGCRRAVSCLSPGQAGENTTIRMVRVTVRDARFAVTITLPEGAQQPARMDLLLADCVFAPQTPDGAVVALVGESLPHVTVPILETASPRGGDASLLKADTRAAVWLNPQSGVVTSLPENLVIANDLVPSILQFETADLFAPEAPALAAFEAPRLSRTIPGADPTSLPPVPADTPRSTQSK